MAPGEAVQTGKQKWAPLREGLDREELCLVPLPCYPVVEGRVLDWLRCTSVVLVGIFLSFCRVFMTNTNFQSRHEDDGVGAKQLKVAPVYDKVHSFVYFIWKVWSWVRVWDVWVPKKKICIESNRIEFADVLSRSKSYCGKRQALFIGNGNYWRPWSLFYSQ